MTFKCKILHINYSSSKGFVKSRKTKLHREKIVLSIDFYLKDKIGTPCIKSDLILTKDNCCCD